MSYKKSKNNINNLFHNNNNNNKNVNKINSLRVRIADIEGNEAEELINPGQCHAVLQLAPSFCLPSLLHFYLLPLPLPQCSLHIKENSNLGIEALRMT